MKRCPNCKSQNMLFDSVSNTYTCCDCNHMFDKIESRQIPMLVTALVSILMLIPLLNIMILCLVSKSNNESFKDAMIGVFMCSWILCGTAVMCGSEVLSIFRESITESIYSQATKDVRSEIEEEYLKKESLLTDEIDSLKVSINTMEEEEEQQEETTEHTLYDFEDNFLYYAVNGSSALEIIEKCKEYNIGILLQTKAMVDKYDDTYYRNISTRLECVTKSESDNFYLSSEYVESADKLVTEIWTDEYGEYELLPTKDVSNKKYIFNVKKTSLYSLYPITNSKGCLIGFTLKEN